MGNSNTSSNTIHQPNMQVKQPNLLPRKKGGQIIAFHSESKWKQHIEASKQTTKLSIQLDFIKINVDNDLHDVAEEFNMQAMPTFKPMKEGKVVDKIVGNKKDDLWKKIDKNRS